MKITKDGKVVAILKNMIEENIKKNLKNKRRINNGIQRLDDRKF